MPKPKTTPKKPKTPTDTEENEGEEGEEGENEGEEGEEQDRRINAIVTSRVNRALKPLNKAIGDLTAQITKLATPKSEEGEDGEEGEEEETPAPTRKGAKPSSGDNKKLSQMERRLKDAEDRAEKAELARKEQDEKAKRAEENSAIGAALVKAGITDPKVAKAITLSMREDGLIVRDEDNGKIRFKTVDKYGVEDFVDPDVGMAKWIKTDGKSFLPAVNAGGSGAGGQGAQNPIPGQGMTQADLGKLNKVERARLDLERASQGLPPIGQ